MKLVFTERAWSQYLYWQQSDRKMLKRINALIADIKREPFSGLGRPEPLKHEFSGFWSRRIDAEHRLVYTVEGDFIEIVQCRFHY